MILALETAFSYASVCLFDEKKQQTVALKIEHAPRLQTQRILPLIEELLQEQAVSLSQITTIAFNAGPASFSGVRINTAVAQALAFAHDIPCIAVSCLQAQAQAMFLQNDVAEVTIINDAKMKEVYLANFTKSEHGAPVLQGEQQMLPLTYDFSQSITTAFVTGDAVTADTPVVSLESTHASILEDTVLTAEHIAMVASHELARAVPAHEAQPVYLRNNAWKTLKEQKAYRDSKKS